MEPIVYTLDETAELLKVSRSTVRNLIRRGELHPVKIGNSVRVTAEELHRILHREPEPEPDPEQDTQPNG